MAKRGQVSVYIIIAVIIVTIFSVYLYSRTSETSQSLSQQVILTPEDYLSQTKAMVQICLDESSIAALFALGTQGRLEGTNYLHLYDGPVEIMSIDGQPNMPTLTQLSQETSRTINELTDSCIQKQLLRGEPLYPIKAGSSSASVTFTEQKTAIDATIPIEVTVNGQSFTAQKFATSMILRLPLVYSVMETLITEAQDDPSTIASEVLTSAPLPISIATIDSNTYMYEITDPQSMIGGEPFVYRFALTYTGERK